MEETILKLLEPFSEDLEEDDEIQVPKTPAAKSDAGRLTPSFSAETDAEGEPRGYRDPWPPGENPQPSKGKRTAACCIEHFVPFCGNYQTLGDSILGDTLM